MSKTTVRRDCYQTHARREVVRKLGKGAYRLAAGGEGKTSI